MLKITFYTRSNCHLCEQAKADLEALQARFPHTLTEIDIAGDVDLEAAYGLDIPVIEVGPYRLKAPFDRRDLAMTLGAARDRVSHLQAVEDPKYARGVQRGERISPMDRFARWFAQRYMLVFNLFVLLYVGLPFVAPVMLRAGMERPANVIYTFYGGLCHQLSYRSFFLFGEQVIYPRAAAGLEGFTTFQQATGLDENAILPARAFRGNEVVGYKVALCQRDVAIYGAILLFGLLFAATGRKWRPLPFWVWLLVGIIPIGWDGGSQLIGAILENLHGPLWDFLGQIFPPRESVPALRVLTGFLFGFTTAWFGYPLVEEAMRDTRLLLTKKFAQVEGVQPGGG